MSETIVDFYRDRTVFLTGGTGFLGKVLLEKLLRSCPQIGRIYLLIRPGTSDGKSPQLRLKQLLAERVFRFNCSQLDLSKVWPIGGDITKPNLAISDNDRRLLIDSVSIVIHSAANVRFTGPLNSFVRQNALGTDNVMAFASQITNLKAILHVSTAYSNCHLNEVEEKVYPLKIPTQILIEEIFGENSKDTPRAGHPLLQGRPNGYTLSKAIAERIVEEKYSHLPVVICRPSIVAHAYSDPVEGWSDSLNGIGGALRLAGLGIARTMNININHKADIIPVDFVANSLIVIAYHTATNPELRKPVVNIISGADNSATWGQILRECSEHAKTMPFSKMIRPIATIPEDTTSRTARVKMFLTRLISQTLFAYLMDLILIITGHKPILVKITKKMHRATDVLQDFTNREWHFHNQHYRAIWHTLSEEEQRLFTSNVAHIDWPKYTYRMCIGTRRYLHKEDDSTIELGLIRKQRVELIWSILRYVFYALLLTLIYFYSRNLILEAS